MIKKIISALLLVSAGFIAIAQDTLYFYDGTKLPVRLIDVSTNEVSYKNWSNLNGPTWKKPRSAIADIIYKDAVVPSKEEAVIDFSKGKSLGSDEMSGNEIIRHIDSLYTNNYNNGNMIIASRDIPLYMQSLPNSVNKKKIHNYYFDKFIWALENSNGSDNDIIKYGEIYLYIGAEKEFDGVITNLAKVYASNGEKPKVDNMIERLKSYSAKYNNEYDEVVEKLKKVTFDLLNPKSVEEQYVGTWIEIAEKYHGINPLILKINDLSTGNLRLLVNAADLSLEKHNGKNEIIYDKSINFPQGGIGYNGNIGRFTAQFATTKISDNSWMLEYQKKMLEYSNKKTAEELAEMKVKNQSQKKVFTDTYFNILSQNLLQAEMRSLPYTYSKYELYLFSFSKPISNVIIAQEAYNKRIITDTQYGADEFAIDDDKSVLFVRWEEEDSLMFVSGNGLPITLSPFGKKDPLVKEYYQIKRSTSFGRPQCLIPFLAGTALGGYLMYLGIKGLINDKYGVYAAGFSGGLITISTAIAVPVSLCKKQRNKKFAELNTRNYEKAKQKIPAEFAFSPLYNPFNSTIGASVNLNF